MIGGRFQVQIGGVDFRLRQLGSQGAFDQQNERALVIENQILLHLFDDDQRLFTQAGLVVYVKLDQDSSAILYLSRLGDQSCWSAPPKATHQNQVPENQRSQSPSRKFLHRHPS